MATTQYYEASLPQTDHSETPEEKFVDIELLISSFTGKHEIYLSVVNGDGHAAQVVLDRDQAKELHESLGNAMSYLGYDR